MEKKREEEEGKKWSLKNFLIRSIDTSIEQTRIFSNGSQIHFHNKYSLFQSTYHMKIQLTIIYFDKNIVPPPLFLYTYVQKFSNGNCNSRAKGISFNWLKNTSVDKIRGKNLIDRVRKIRVWLAVRTARIEFRASVISDDFCRGRGNPRENKRFERKRFSSRHFLPAVERAHTSP